MHIHPLYTVTILIFIAHQLLQKAWKVSIPLADQYLDPLLCMPLLLGLWQWEQRLLFRRRVTSSECWLLTVLLTGLFELAFPLWSARFTADWRDALLYVTGTAIFLSVRRSIPSPSQYRVSS